MKQNLIRFAAVATMAAEMVFAQAPASSPQLPARQQPMSREERRERFRERMTRELNLTSAQQQQAKALFGKVREDTAPLRKQLQNREALHAAIQADNTPEIHSLAAKQATLRAQITEMRADAKAKFYATLTPEQRPRRSRSTSRCASGTPKPCRPAKAAYPVTWRFRREVAGTATRSASSSPRFPLLSGISVMGSRRRCSDFSCGFSPGN
jgi:Spy/CpxP family protein refolding chaperone